MDGSALYRRYRELQTAAGVRSLRFHDLRHTFGTQAIASGAHVKDVKEWMGHRHLSTTMRCVHHQPRHEAAARLERHFTGAASELDALLGEPGDLDIGPPDSPVETTLDDPNKAVRRFFVVISGSFWLAPIDRVARTMMALQALSSCRRRDSNPRHADYDSAALTD